MAAHPQLQRRAEAEAADPRPFCLGRCYQALASDTGRPHVEVDAPREVVLGPVVAGGAATLAAYRAAGGYRALTPTFAAPPAGVADVLRRVAPCTSKSLLGSFLVAPDLPPLFGGERPGTGVPAFTSLEPAARALALWRARRWLRATRLPGRLAASPLS